MSKFNFSKLFFKNKLKFLLFKLYTSLHIFFKAQNKSVNSIIK